MFVTEFFSLLEKYHFAEHEFAASLLGNSALWPQLMYLLTHQIMHMVCMWPQPPRSALAAHQHCSITLLKVHFCSLPVRSQKDEPRWHYIYQLLEKTYFLTCIWHLTYSMQEKWVHIGAWRTEDLPQAWAYLKLFIQVYCKNHLSLDINHPLVNLLTPRASEVVWHEFQVRDSQAGSRSSISAI